MTNPTVTFHPILDTYDGSTPPSVQEGYPTINLGGGAGALETTISSAPVQGDASYGQTIVRGGKRKYRKSKKSKSKKSKSKKSKSKKSKSKTKKSKSKRKMRLSKKSKRSKNRRSKKSRRSKKKRR